MNILFLHRGLYTFADHDYEGRGVGGTEAALIQISRELARQKHSVWIAQPASAPGNYHGVHYVSARSLSTQCVWDAIVVSWQVQPIFFDLKARRRLYWTTIEPWWLEAREHVQRGIFISPYHYEGNGSWPGGAIIPLGIDPAEYDSGEGIAFRSIAAKEPGRLIYCSVPDRGLEHLVRIFPMIREEIPWATLWITSDYSLWGRQPDIIQYLGLMADTPGVHYYGKIPREDLVYQQKRAEIMLYPTHSEENFCLSALECMAAGTVPVTSARGALPTTVGEHGVLVNEMPGTEGAARAFADATIALLCDRERLKRLSASGRERALTEFNWQYIVRKHWLPVLKGGSRRESTDGAFVPTNAVHLRGSGALGSEGGRLDGSARTGVALQPG